MAKSDLIRWGGLAAMLAGVAFVVSGLLPSLGLANPEDPSDAPLLDGLFVLALLLVVAALFGFHALQKGNYGRIGRAGFYTVVVATLVQVVGLVGFMLGSTALEWLIPLGSLAVLVGFILYGAATLQARVLPRWCGVGFIVGLPVATVLGQVWGALVFGLLWLALGYVLWSQRGVSADQPSRVR